MNQKAYFVLILVGCLLLFALSNNASAQNDQKFSVRIGIEIVADQEIKNEALSYLSREFRSLNDAIITDQLPEYTFQIVILTAATKNGYPAGYAMSLVITEPIDQATIRIINDNLNLNETQFEILNYLLARQKKINTHQLFTFPSDGLRGTLQKIVASFDAETLIPLRKSWERTSNQRRSK